MVTCSLYDRILFQQPRYAIHMAGNLLAQRAQELPIDFIELAFQSQILQFGSTILTSARHIHLVLSHTYITSAKKGPFRTNLMFVSIRSPRGSSPKDSSRPAMGRLGQYVSCSPFCPNEHQSNEPNPQRVPCHPAHRKPIPSVEIFPHSSFCFKKTVVYFFFWLASCSFITFLTIFCSSIKKARTILSRTQLPHREPP